MIKLRPYQEKAVSDIRSSFIAGKRSPLLCLPTGGGKTIVFTYIAANSSARGKRVLILVHRVELLRQTSAALGKFGIHHGLINPQFTPDTFAPVQVASVQTLVRRLNKQRFAPDLIIVDEAHHATAGTWRTILQAYPNALTLGVTATPVRSDGNGLGVDAGGIFDEMIIGPQIGELIRLGFLVRPAVYAPEGQLDLSGVRSRMGDFAKDELLPLIDKPSITGNAVEHYRKLAHGSPGVAFCINVAHAEHVAADFRAAGYRAYSVDGSMEDERRNRILAGLGNGSVDIVTSCDLISEGTDIPAIGAAILLRPTKSLGLYIQQVGRALRPSPGKERAIILDHVGNVIRHGLPDEEREWGLDGEEKSRRGKQEREKPISVYVCEGCYAVYDPAPACPHCGKPREIKVRQLEEAEGELKEITEADALALKRARAREVARAKTLEELEAVARARGYKPAWAKHIYNHRQSKHQ
jgi:DNA repair protein RadD